MKNLHTIRTTLALALSISSAVALVAPDVDAAPRAPSGSQRATRAKAHSCPVRAALLLGQYFERGEFRCLLKAAPAKSSGLVMGSAEVKKRKLRQGDRCRYVAFPPTGLFFVKKDTRCFRSRGGAENAGYTKFLQGTPSASGSPDDSATATPAPGTPVPDGTVAVTPTPGPGQSGETPQPGATSTPTPVPSNPAATATPVSVTPTPTPTVTPTFTGTYPPSGQPLLYSFLLYPVTAGSGYSGSCTAELSGDRTHLTVQCTHNVTGASAAHAHIIPFNEPFCGVPTPGSPFTLDCTVTPDQSAGIVAGWGLISVHLAPGGENQAINGYIRNTP